MFDADQSPIAVTKRKLARGAAPGDIYRWSSVEVAADEFGAWLWCRRGTPHDSPRQPAAFVMPCDGLQLLGAERGWVAWWWDKPRWISVDVCDGPVFDGDAWTYTDLEVDVAKFEDGTVHLLDEDELAEVVAAGLVAPDTASRALATAQEVFRALTEGTEPFGQTGWRRLDALQTRST